MFGFGIQVRFGFEFEVDFELDFLIRDRRRLSVKIPNKRNQTNQFSFFGFVARQQFKSKLELKFKHR